MKKILIFFILFLCFTTIVSGQGIGSLRDNTKVPYSGARQNLDMGAYDILATNYYGAGGATFGEVVYSSGIAYFASDAHVGRYIYHKDNVGDATRIFFGDEVIRLEVGLLQGLSIAQNDIDTIKIGDDDWKYVLIGDKDETGIAITTYSYLTQGWTMPFGVDVGTLTVVNWANIGGALDVADRSTLQHGSFATGYSSGSWVFSNNTDIRFKNAAGASKQMVWLDGSNNLWLGDNSVNSVTVRSGGATTIRASGGAAITCAANRDVTIASNTIIIKNLDVNGISTFQHASMADGFSTGTFKTTDNITVTKAADPTFFALDTTNNCLVKLLSSDSLGLVGTNSNHPFYIRTNNQNRISVFAGGHVDMSSSVAIADTLNVGSFLTCETTVYANTGNFAELISHSPTLEINTEVNFNQNVDFNGNQVEGVVLISSGTLAEAYISTNTNVTQIASQNVYYIVDGTLTVNTGCISWFSAANGVLTYNYTAEKRFFVNINISATDDGSTETFMFALFKNGAVIPEGRTRSKVTVTKDTVVTFPLSGCVSLVQGDTLSVYVKDLTGTGNILIEEMNFSVYATD